ncbi:MAG: electron transfer flavoprotein beta subunit/FixA family protein [Actinobacteria bacterium]|jgi:electron transfer flavoprotein beta subunit|nr:MAG: electron transfer flavoprotein beta subunit/FixA family protein [Actinomycetota bacterium]
MAVDIIVCAKQVPDPEGPPSSFEVNEAERRVTARGIPPVINPFDENALETAIRIKEATGAAITLLSLGKGLSRAVILKAVAAGADSSLLVEDDAFDAALLDSFTTAHLLAGAISKAGPYDLILCGRQAADTNAGMVGLILAQFLGVPAITLAQKVEVSEGRVVVERVLPDGYEVVEAPLPALVTVSGEVGDLRYPSLQAIKAAKGFPQTALGRADLDLNLPALARLETVALAIPSRERRCALVEGDTLQEAGRKLALLLRQEKVL